VIDCAMFAIRDIVPWQEPECREGFEYYSECLEILRDGQEADPVKDAENCADIARMTAFLTRPQKKGRRLAGAATARREARHRSPAAPRGAVLFCGYFAAACFSARRRCRRSSLRRSRFSSRQRLLAARCCSRCPSR